MISQCPDCGATFRPGAPACPECGVELLDDDLAADDTEAEQDKLDRIVGKVLTGLRARFDCNDEADIPGGFLFTDLADGTTYELRVSKFDQQAWMKG